MGLVYFIMDEHERVKIGYTNSGPKKRLKYLQHNNADLLTLIGVVHGTPRTETKLHKRFQEQWIRGEWYRIEGDLKEYINEKVQPSPPEKDYRIIRVYPDGSKLL